MIMESKNIFEKSSSKRIIYYVAVALCIVAVGVLSVLSLKSQKQQTTPEQKTKTDTSDTVNVPKTDVKEQEPEPQSEQQETATTPEPQTDTQKQTESVSIKPYVMPLEGEVTAVFSLETPIYSTTLEDWRMHDGIDISAAIGTDVVAVNDGVVEEIYNDDLFGITVVIRHTDGKKSTYCNLEDSVELEKGQIIKQKDIVGKVGNTAVFEMSDGDHLHFEMSENGKKIDPIAVIGESKE